MGDVRLWLPLIKEKKMGYLKFEDIETIGSYDDESPYIVIKDKQGKLYLYKNTLAAFADMVNKIIKEEKKEEDVDNKSQSQS